MTGENWLSIEATLMTSQAIEAYGGIRFSPEALEAGASSLNAGNVPMHADHDQTQPVRFRNLRAWVDDGADGFYRLKLSYEIHPEDAHFVDERRGMSAAVRAPLEGRGDRVDRVVAVELSADHAWFADDALIEAESRVMAAGLQAAQIRTERVYQFSFVPDPQIFLTVVLPIVGTVATGALGSALWDAVKALFRRRHTPPNGDESAATRVNIRLEDGRRSLTALVETHDATVANQALDAFDALAQEFMAAPSSTNTGANLDDKRLLVWDDDAGTWLPHLPPQVQRPLPPDGSGRVVQDL